MKKLISKILIMIMLISIIYVPTTVLASNDFNLTITEDAFGIKEKIDINIKNKVKGSEYMWISSNEKVATVNKVGVVKGLKAGDVIITCIITTPDGETHEFTSNITINSKTKITAVNQKQLEAALANEDVEQIIIKTSKDIELVIPEGKYNKRLYMKAPEANIINEGDFKSVHTYVANQEQLEEALANDKVTIVTIVTDEEESFDIVGDYSRIRLIINAPEATILNNAVLRGVDIKEVNKITEKIYTPEEVKEEETPDSEKEKEKEEEVIVPVIPGGGGGGGNYPPVDPNPQPSNPTPTPTPTELLVKAKQDAINKINAEADKYDTSNLDLIQQKELEDLINAEIKNINNVTELINIEEECATALSRIKEFKPSAVLSELEQAKIDAINDINTKKNQYLPSIPSKHIDGFNQMVNDAIDNINDAETIVGINTTFESVMSNIETYYIPDTGAEEQLAIRQEDYNKFLSGVISIDDLYDKYARSTDGYETSISPNVNETGIISLYLSSMNYVVIVYVYDNKTVIYDDNSDDYYTKQEGYNSELEISNDVGRFYPIDLISGMIVSYNNSTRTITIDDLTTLNASFVTKEDSELSKWQDELGKWYYGYPTNPTSLDTIRTDDGKEEITTSAVSGSAITFDFKLYKNNTEGVNRVCFAGSFDELGVEYYSVIYHEDNTANIVFNNLFVQDYIMIQTESKLLSFVIFPTKTSSNGTGITFDITVDHIKR